MKHRIPFILLLVLAATVLLCATALPASAATEGDYEYKLINNDMEVCITKYVGSGGTVYIPVRLEGKAVTEIGEYAFGENTNVTSVWIGETVRSIDHHAFYGCKGLKKVEFSEGLEAIHTRAFSYCTALESLTFPNSLTEIEDKDNYGVCGVFEGCTALRSVVFGSGIKLVPMHCFYGCSSLETVVLPEGLEGINYGAFYRCKLNTVTLPDSVAWLGDNAFSECAALTSIEFGKGLESVGLSAFAKCTALKTLELPDSLKTLKFNLGISGGTFQGCKALVSVKTGEGLSAISGYCFADCSALSSVSFGSNLTSIDRNAFAGCSALKTLSFPDALSVIEFEAFRDCRALRSVEFGSGLKEIGGRAFSTCVALTGLELPDELEYLRSEAFYNCLALKTVKCGSGLREIGSGAFSSCGALESVTLGDAVETIAYSAFNNCGALKRIDLKNVQTIGQSAFAGCKSLSAVAFGGSLRWIDSAAFSGCSALTELVLPDALEKLGGDSYYYTNVFEKCSALKKVTIGEGLQIVAESAFTQCTGLESVSFGSRVDTIRSRAFARSVLKTAYFLGDAPSSIENLNDELNKASWYWLPGAQGFTGGSVASPVCVVTVDANGGRMSGAGYESVASYQKKSVNGRTGTPLTPEREGYTFLGWYLNAEGTGSPVDFNSYTVRGDLTVYAKWEVKSYRILFDPRGGSVSSGGRLVQYGEPIGALPTPELAGDTFLGWYPGMNGSGPRYTETSAMPAQDLVLYASWQNNASALTVLFDPDGGSFLSPLNAVSGSPVARPADPKRDGYRFVGWYKDAGHWEKYDFEAETVSANLTLHALWAPLFRDVPAGAYYSAAVAWAVENGVTTGTSSTKFSPGKPCTRGQVVTFLWRAAGSPEPESGANPFTDVKSSDYFCNAVLWAVEKDITKGTSATKFSPGTTCTRGQIVTFLWRATGSAAPKSSVNPFTDVQSSGYYYQAVLWAVEKDITKGTSATKFSPNAKCTRGQVVTFLHRSQAD